MKKIFILLAASVICFACKSGTGDTNSSITSLDLSVETPANKIAEHVLIDSLYYDLYDNNTAEVVRDQNGQNNYASLNGELIIPSSIDYDGTIYTVTSIGDHAFLFCEGLTSVTIPNTVISVGMRAFACYKLKSPIYNDHVFARLPSDYSGVYAIPRGIQEISGGAFSDCTGLTSVTIPNSVTSIGDYAFGGCFGLTSITIPNSVTSIGNQVFRYCTLNKPVYNDHVFVYLPHDYSGAFAIHRGTKHIAGWAFYYCKSLTSITIPNSVTTIGDLAFECCTGLTSVTIPNSVTSIGEYAFRGCTGLTSITIPNSVTSIGKSAFEGCTGLTSVTIPNSVTSIGEYAFLHCKSLISVTIPKSVTDIADNAFRGCTNLQIIYEE